MEKESASNWGGRNAGEGKEVDSPRVISVTEPSAVCKGRGAGQRTRFR